MQQSVSVTSPQHLSEVWWTEVCKKVKNATVFTDSSLAEVLHWHGGLARLMDAGARDVKEFSSFERGEKESRKAVFLVSSVLDETRWRVLRDIISASSFQYCVFVTSVHPQVQAFFQQTDQDADEEHIASQLEDDMLTWMGNKNYTVEVVYYPLVFIPVMEELLLAPVFHDLYPLIDSDINKLLKIQKSAARDDKGATALKSLSDVELTDLPHTLRVTIRHLVSCFHSLLQGMDAKEEIFTLGHTARMIGTDLETYAPARQRRKTASKKVSLVIVDRTLDLIKPVSHECKTLMDRILPLLPRLPGHKIDSAVNMAPVSHVHPSCEWTLVPGCLVHPTEEGTKIVLERMISASRKEAVTLLSAKVEDALRKKSLSGKRRETIEQLRLGESLQLLALDTEAFSENVGLIQQGLGIVEALEHPDYSHQEKLLSLEKSLLHSLEDPCESLFAQVMQQLKTRKLHQVSLEEVLSLLVFVGSLGGPEVFPQALHYSLTNKLSEALLEEKWSPSPTIASIVGRDIDEVSALKTAQQITERLQAISCARQHLHNYRWLHRCSSEGLHPTELKGLLQQLVHDCLVLPHNQLTDLQCRSAGLRDLIKTSFSLFVNVSKPMPRDAAMMIMYVVGGVTPAEVTEMKEVISELQPQCSVALASSHLTYPSDALSLALRDNVFHPL